MGDGLLFLGDGLLFLVYSKCGNANVFSFICLNKLPESFWISFQAVSNVVVNIVDGEISKMEICMDEEYKMGDAVLGRTTQEKDLGVTFSADMKVSKQRGIAASTANKILGLIRRIMMYKEKQLIVPLYKAIVRPHLEYCIQAWRPYRKKDIDKLERIQ